MGWDMEIVYSVLCVLTICIVVAFLVRAIVYGARYGVKSYNVKISIVYAIAAAVGGILAIWGLSFISETLQSMWTEIMQKFK